MQARRQNLQVNFGYYMHVLFSRTQRIIASELDFMTQRGNFEECLRAIAMRARGSNLSNTTNLPVCLPVLITYDKEFSSSWLSV